MPVASPRAATDIAEIQRRMAQIRHDMHREVQGEVKGAQLLTDWRSLVQSHPWLVVSLAAAAGYLVVPRRSASRAMPVASGFPGPELYAAPNTRAETPPPGRSRWSILGTAFSLLAPVAARAAQNYALGHLEQWLSQHPLSPSPTGSPDAPNRDSGQTAPTGPINRLRQYD